MENTKPKVYDLEDRTFEFAKAVRYFIQKLSKTIGVFFGFRASDFGFTFYLKGALT